MRDMVGVIAPLALAAILASAPLKLSPSGTLAPQTAHAVEVIEEEGPALMDEDVARARLAKLGYSDLKNASRKDDVWTIEGTKNGAPVKIQLHARDGHILAADPMK
jgi:hypothetical protein